MSPVPAAERNDDQGNHALDVVKVLSVALLLGVVGGVAFVAAVVFEFFDGWNG